MASVEDISITIIDEQPGPTVIESPTPHIDLITVDGIIQPQILEVAAEMQITATIDSALDPEVVEIDRPNDISTITLPQVGEPEVLEVLVAGPQGRPGVQNVWVGPNPPADPEVNWIWIDTTT